MKMHLMLPDNSAMCGNKAKAFLRTSHVICVSCQKCLAAYNKQNNVLLFNMVRQLVGALRPLKDFAFLISTAEDPAAALKESDPAEIIKAGQWAIETLLDAEKIIDRHGPVLTDKSDQK